MEIASVVTRLVVRAEAAETLAAAARRMWAHEIGALPVFKGDRLLGIVTEQDLVTALALGAGANAAIATHLTPLPATAEITDDSAMVAQRMLDLGVRHLPVRDGGRVIGMVSARDLLPLVAWPAAPRARPAAASA
jgi:CBS domain-containing protein